MDRSFVDEYEQGGLKLAQAIRGLTRQDLLSRPAPDSGVGLWSIQEVALHLCDSELVLAERMKRVIAEDNPTLLSFDETRWAENLHYAEQSAEDAGAMVELARRQMATVLRALPDSAFGRFGTHNAAGRKTLADLVRSASSHLEHHLKFIHCKRAAMGKEMW